MLPDSRFLKRLSDFYISTDSFILAAFVLFFVLVLGIVFEFGETPESIKMGLYGGFSFYVSVFCICVLFFFFFFFLKKEKGNSHADNTNLRL